MSHKKITKIFSVLLCFLLIFEQSGFAQMVGQLDISGYLASLSNAFTQDKFRPLHLRYLSYDTENNNFRLLLDKGDLKDIKSAQVEETTQKLLEFFFVGVSLPNDSFWVNLRPDSPENIIDPYLAQTDVGKILLEADLQLKKDTAKFTSPENPKGKEYWDKLYKKASEIFGYDNVTIPTLTRPWIVPDEIIIREANDNAYIYKATLKVRLEQDYLKDSAVYNFEDSRLKDLNAYSSQLIRELIIPELTKEINTSKRYAPLRQVYYSLILAQWFKQRFSSRGGFYSGLIDRRNLNGLTSKEDWSRTAYFKAYQKSFKDGEYNIKEPIHTPFGQTIRSYFSGGIDFGVSQGQGVGAITTAIQRGLVKAATPGDVLAGNSHILPVDVNKGGTLDNVGVDRKAIKLGKIEDASSPLDQREIESQNLSSSEKDHPLHIDFDEIIKPPIRTSNKIPLILITGFPGAGKSTVGNSLSQNLGIPFISLGVVLRQMWQKDPTIPNYPELGFEKLKEYIQKENIGINYGIILDSNIPFREWKELLDEFLEENNFYLAAIININSPEEIVRQRLRERERLEDKKPLKVQDYIPGEIETRIDKRIAQHKNIAIPVIEDYKKEDFYIELNNEGSLEFLEGRVRDALNRLIDLHVINQINRLRVYNNILKKAAANNWSLSDIWNFYIPIAESIIEIQKKDERKKLIIGIGGPTGSGKSVFSLILREVLAQLSGDGRIGIIKQDNFFYTDDELERFNISRRNAPDSVRINWILERINDFKNNKPINQPRLEKTEGKRIRLDVEEAVKAESILIVDGVYVLNNDTPEYRKLFDEFNVRIFIDANFEDIENWWIDREFEKGMGGKENLSRKWQDELRLFIEQQKNLWINSDLIIKKRENHALENVYLISPMGKGSCLEKIKEVSLNILHQEVRSVIEVLKKLVESAELSMNERNKASEVIGKLAQLEKEGKIGSFDLVAKGNRDYLVGFADVEKERIGLAHEFFRQGKLLNKDLNNALFYLGYILTFNLPYQAADPEYLALQKNIFGKDDVLSQEGIIQTVKETLNPQQVYYLPLKTAELEKLNSYEGKDSLNLARLLVKDIMESCGGRLPKVMFVTPTQKGGGVTALVKDIAEVLFSPEIGIQGGWVSTVRHQNPDFWGISGKFQRALDGSPEEITDSDVKIFDNAMAWNAERLDLEGVDFIFLHDPFTLGMIPFIRKKYPHVKIIWVNHGDISRATDIAKGLMKRYLASADIAIFSWMKDYIPKDGVGIPAIHMIHGLNLTNTKNIELSPSFINAVASRYGIDRNRPIILQVGRFNPSKDPLQSIASFFRLKKILIETGINVKPQLILSGIPISPGDWALYNHLMKLKEHLGDSDIHIIASDNQVVELTKDEKDTLVSMGIDLSNTEPWELSDLEMNALQRMATMGIHPAITEGFGLVISEALIKGTPVIASAVGGIPMQIEDEQFLVNLPETHKDEIGKKYRMLSEGQFDSLLELLNDDPLTLSFATNMLNVLEMDKSELTRLISKAKSRIFVNYSILRSLIGHLTVIDLLTKGEQDKVCRNEVIIEDEGVVLCRQLMHKLKREVLDAEDFNIIKNKMISFGEVSLGLLINEIKNSKTESYDYRFRLQKVLSEIGIRYIPRIIEELGTEDEYIREQFYWTLVFMGEIPIDDLINNIKSNTNPYITRGAIQTLVRIGYMGNERITEALKNYLSDRCKVTYDDMKSHFGLLERDYETLGHLCMLISSFNNIKHGEAIAARLLQRGFYPSRDTIEKISNEVGNGEELYSKIEEMLQSFERRMRQIEINGDFAPQNPLDLILGYTILLKEAKEKQIVLRVSYEEYEHLIKTGKETSNLVLDNAGSLTEKQIAELNYLSSEALRLRQFILEVQNKAKKLGLPLLVIANKTYGEIAISPIEEDLVKNGITVFKRRLASDKTHLYPYYMEGDLFSDEEIKFIVDQRPIIIVVDGTNSLRRTVLELTGRRSRTPHYPDAYLGYRNYFIAMSEALGAKVLPSEFHISAETLKTIETSLQFMRIKEKIASVATAVSPEGYRMFFWSNSGFGLPIREDRKEIETPNNIDSNEIQGSAIIFAQTCTRDESIPIQAKALTHNIVHTSGYYDIAFEELGYRNFFFDVTIDNFGPQLKSLFKDNKSVAEEYTNLNTNLITLKEFIESDIKPLSYEENVHIKYKEAEKATLELQRYYENLIRKCYPDLIQVLDSQDIAQAIKLLERLIILRKGLHFVLKAREKFVKLGWPCRHSHANFDGDDGDFTPEELVGHAIANGITALYVTGHNTLEGSIQAIKYAQKKDYIIEMKPAVEIETPFEDEKGKLFGFMHWRIIGPNDINRIEQMRKLIREIDRRLEIFLGTKFEKILSLADRDNFERLVNNDVIESLKSHYDVKRGNFILLGDTDSEIKDKLYQALRELQDYVERTPRAEYMPKFLNKLNIIGSWTERIWVDKGDTRRALRALSDILFNDENIISYMREIGQELPISTQEALRRFSEIGCYSIAAHPGLEISKDEIAKHKFIKLAVAMAQEGILQGAGRGWEDARADIDDMIDQITSLSGSYFRKDGSNPDFHGPKKSDIRRGDRLSSGEYAQDGEEPDREGYFIELEFLSKDYLKTIKGLIEENKNIEALKLISMLDEINYYGDVCEKLLNDILEYFRTKHGGGNFSGDKNSPRDISTVDPVGVSTSIAEKKVNKDSGSSPIDQDYINSDSVNILSPKDQTNKKGGIDFRALSIVTQKVNTPTVNLNAMPLSRLNDVNLDSEWSQIRNMLNAGITPSSERIKEYLLACCQKRGLDKELDKILGCIADIMRIEEERVLATNPDLKVLLVLLESGETTNEIQSTLDQIKFLPKEPEPVIP